MWFRRIRFALVNYKQVAYSQATIETSSRRAALRLTPTKSPALLSKAGLFVTASKPYGAYVSSNSVGTLKSRDIITLNAVMVKIENTNSLRAQTVSSTAL